MLLQMTVKTSTETTVTSTESFYKTLSAPGFSPLCLMGLLILSGKFYSGVTLSKPMVRAEHQMVSMNLESARMPEGKIPGPQVNPGQVR